MLLRVKRIKIGPYGMCAAAIIALAVLLRIVLTLQVWPQTNADEGTMGIMALHIAYRGERPIFFYGQDYMGVLEAYLAAVVFHIFGASVFTLRLVTMLLFALFLTGIYFLASLLYTKKLALITLALLSLGSVITLQTELVAIGGYPELLLFGTLAFLLASWLAISSGQYSSLRRQLLRFIALGAWGLVVGLGFWSDYIMLTLALISLLLLLVFCWRDLLKGGILFLLLGLAIGAYPLIKYNLMAPSDNTLVVLWRLHNTFSVKLASYALNHNPLIAEIQGTALVGLPSITGAPPLCYDENLLLFGHPSMTAFYCLSVPGDWGLTLIALCWSAGFMVLWLISVLHELKMLWKLRLWRRSARKLWSSKERQAVRRHFARLALLGSTAVALLQFVLSPVSALFPTNARYLTGLLIATPALIAPLWGLSHDDAALSSGRETRPRLVERFAMFRMILGRGLLVLIGVVLLIGTISAFLEIPTVQAYNRQQDALMRTLLRINATHIYSDYWTCDRVAFVSREQIICGVINNSLQPSYNRYLGYYPIMKADPYSAYVFPAGSGQLTTIARQVAQSRGRYQRYVFDGYVIYQPVRPGRLPNASRPAS